MKIIAAMKVTDHDSDLVNTVKTAIHTNILERYNSPEIENVLFLAMALDPRFKSLPHLDTVKRESVYTALQTRTLDVAKV